MEYQVLAVNLNKTAFNYAKVLTSWRARESSSAATYDPRPDRHKLSPSFSRKHPTGRRGRRGPKQASWKHIVSQSRQRHPSRRSSHCRATSRSIVGGGAVRRRPDEVGLDLHLVKPAVMVGVLKWFAQVLGADGPDLWRSRVTSDDRCSGGWDTGPLGVVRVSPSGQTGNRLQGCTGSTCLGGSLRNRCVLRSPRPNGAMQSVQPVEVRHTGFSGGRGRAAGPWWPIPGSYLL